MKSHKLKCLYNNVVSQTFSASGNYIFAGNTFGDIFVLEIDEILSTENKIRKDPKIYPQGEGTISSLEFHRDFLIVGAQGTLYGLKFKEEKGELATSKSWEVQIPHSPDVNCLWLNKEVDDQIFAGCDNGAIHLISLECGKIERSFEHHKDLVHCVTGGDGKIYSGSEDGTLLVWSPKDKLPVGKIEPYKVDSIMRPELGKFVGACAVSSDWLICGGGPKLSMWHLRSLECLKDFTFPGKVHCAGFLDDLILAGGVHSAVHMYSFNGNLQTDLAVDNTAVYSIAWQTEPQRIMSIGGYNNKLSVLTDFRFIDTTVNLYKEENHSN